MVERRSEGHRKERVRLVKRFFRLHNPARPFGLRLVSEDADGFSAELRLNRSSSYDRGVARVDFIERNFREDFGSRSGEIDGHDRAAGPRAVVLRETFRGQENRLTINDIRAHVEQSVDRDDLGLSFVMKRDGTLAFRAHDVPDKLSRGRSMSLQRVVAFITLPFRAGLLDGVAKRRDVGHVNGFAEVFCKDIKLFPARPATE